MVNYILAPLRIHHISINTVQLSLICNNLGRVPNVAMLRLGQGSRWRTNSYLNRIDISTRNN